MLPTFQTLNGNLYQIKLQKVLNNIIKYNTSFQDLKLRIDNEKALAEAAKKQQDELFTLQKELLLQQIANARQEGHNQQQLFLKKMEISQKEDDRKEELFNLQKSVYQSKFWNIQYFLLSLFQMFAIKLLKTTGLSIFYLS